MGPANEQEYIMTKSIPTNHNFAVTYVGAPYGSNEGGLLEFTAETEQGATQWLRNHYGSSPKGLDMRIIDLDFNEYSRYQPMTPREYYNNVH